MMRALHPLRMLAFCFLVSTACLSDFKPEVGALNASASDVGPVGGATTGGNGNEPSGSNTNGPSTGGTGSQATTGGDSNGNTSQTGGDSNNTQVNTTAGDDGSVPQYDASIAHDAGSDGPISGCAIKDSNRNKEVSFEADIWPIIAGCSCHDPNAGDPAGVLEVNLVMDSYESLRMGGDNTGTNIVIAGNACDSLILQKLSETPPFGQRMPRDGPYLPLEVRQLISDWITEGARDN